MASSSLLRFLNDTGPAIQAVSTVVLVAVTILYAYFTKQMADLMGRQITSKIVIENAAVGSSFLEENFFTEKSAREDIYYRFTVIFDVRNEGIGTGSIFKPELIIRSYKPASYYKRLSPKTIEHENYNRQERGSMTSWDTRTIDHGRSILLSSGSSERYCLEYSFVATTEDIPFIQEIKEDPKNTSYELVTHDNQKREYVVKISSVKELDKVDLI